jgi:hypothetical protein
LILFWRRQSKRALVVAVLYLAALPVSAAGQPGQDGARPLPKFEIDKTLYDFGEVFAGEEIVVIFSVTNRGNAPLELSDKPLLVTRPAVSLYRRSPDDYSLPLRTAGAFRPAPS